MLILNYARPSDMYPLYMKCVHSVPMDYSPSGFSVYGIFQARILECIAISLNLLGEDSFSKGSSQPRDQIHVSYSSALIGRFFTTEPAGKPNALCTLYSWVESCSFCISGEETVLPGHRVVLGARGPAL